MGNYTLLSGKGTDYLTTNSGFLDTLMLLRLARILFISVRRGSAAAKGGEMPVTPTATAA